MLIVWSLCITQILFSSLACKEQTIQNKTPHEIAASIGLFANYKGINQQVIYNNPMQAFFAKQMLKQLSPEKNWETAALTNLTTPLLEQEGTIVIGTRNDKNAKLFYGSGEHIIPIASLQELSSTAHLYINSTIMSESLYRAITQLPLQQQDVRPLQTILGKNLATWLSNVDIASITIPMHNLLSMPIMLLSSSICHAQEILFFVEQHCIQNVTDTSKKYAYNRLRTDNLASSKPITLLSIPGLNLAYSGINKEKLIASGLAKNIITNMWKTIFATAKKEHKRIIIIPAIGLGAFAGNNPEPIAHIYFETLINTLAHEDFNTAFDYVYYNPSPQFTTLFHSYTTQQLPLFYFSGDTKFLAVELAKAGYECALINPSDADVIWGLYDIGEYYKNGHYAGEEDIAATSTAVLGSKGINPQAYLTIEAI